MEVAQNARMLIVNDGDSATLSQTVGSAVSTLPITNLQLYSNSRIFRSTSVNEVQFVQQWSEPVILSGIALWRHNLSVDATWRIELFSDAALTNKIYDTNDAWPTGMPAVQQKALGELEWLIDPLVSAVTEGRFQNSDHWFDDVAPMAARITIWDASNTAGYIDIGRLYTGRALQPAINFSFGHEFGWLSQTGNKKRTASGSAFAKKRARPRKLDFSLDWISEVDRPHFVNAINQTGDNKDWYISLYPNVGGQKERHYAMACMFSELPKFKLTHHNNYATRYQIEEV